METKTNNEKTNLVSIIIPVYNVETYLRRCIDSVQQQTYTNLEIILVDDGSTDLSGQICNEYSVKDSRIKVVHQKNGGLSDARNTGLKTCQGEYVTYIDSDDYVSSLYIENLIYTALNTNADIVISNYTKVYDNNFETIYDDPLKDICILTAEEALNQYFYGVLQGHAWGNIYKKQILEKNLFPVGKFFEDAFVMPNIIISCSKIVAINCKNYFYMQRDNSIINAKFSIHHMDLIEADLLIYDSLAKKYPCLKSGMNYRIFSDATNIRKKIDKKSNWSNEDQKLKRLIKERCAKILLDKKANTKNRLIACMAFINVDFMNFINQQITQLTINRHLKRNTLK